MIPKFRAFHIAEKRMYRVDGIFLDDYNIVNLTDDNKNYRRSAHFDEIILMQSTGRKDKKGVEIFESDIVEIYIRRGFISWCEATAGFAINFLPSGEEQVKFTLEQIHYYTIRGNIHANPDLLEPDTNEF